ncbi:Carbohydrate-selective porin OprB [Acidocella sp. MX-AZ02]|nr:Carbohydrate-selective porin OprB [Acidocella sp. MX-AZ02]
MAPEGKLLAEHGIYLRATGVDEAAANVTGGQKQGAANSFAVAFGGDLDLGQLMGWDGGSVHVTFNKSVGESLAAGYTENQVSFQSKYKTYHNARLAELTFEQKLFNDKLDVSGGRVSALSYFNTSKIYCNFENNAFCFNPAVVPITDKGLSFYPYGTWGGRVKLSPSPWFYVQAGAFQSDPALIPTDGFEWSSNHATGIETAAEIGIQSPSWTDPYAFHLRAGGYNNGAPVSDPYLNIHGLSLVKSKGKALTHEGGQSAFYVMGDVDVAHLNLSGTRNVTFFGGTLIANRDYLTFTSQTLFGVLVTGPFASRPTDTLGLAGTYLTLGSQEVDYLRAARAAAHGSGGVANHEEIFELNYGFNLYRGIRLNPNVQVVLNPDNILEPSAKHASRDILAFGVRLTINPGMLLGMPTWQ